MSYQYPYHIGGLFWAIKINDIVSHGAATDRYLRSLGHAPGYSIVVKKFANEELALEFARDHAPVVI